MIAFKFPKGDLKLVNGTTQIITGAAYAKQRVTITLDIFLGEWFLDLRIGLPYFRYILIHSPNSEIVRYVMRKGIMNTPGIVAVPELNVVLDTIKRRANVDFVATYVDGTQITQALALIIT